MAEKEVVIKVSADTGSATKDVSDFQKKLGEINNTPIDKSIKTFKQEIKEANNEAQRLAQQFGTTSEQFVDAAKKVAKLKDEFGEYSQTVQAFNPDNKLQALVSVAKAGVSSVSAITGAMTLLGVESDDVQKSIAKLQALMALSDALNSVDDIKNAFKNLNSVIQSSTVFQKANNIVTTIAGAIMKAFGVTVNTTSTAFKFLKGAIAATGIGLLIVLLGEAVQAFQEFTGAADAAKEAQEKFNEYTLKNANEGLKIVQDNLKNQEALAVANAKNEEEKFAITQEYRKRALYAEQDYFNKVKGIDEDAAQDARKRIEKGNVEGTVAAINEKKRIQKIEDDAAKEKKDKADAAAKAARDKSKADADAALELNKKIKDDIELLNKTEREKELIEEDRTHKESLAVLKKGGVETETEIAAHYKRRSAIITKYDNEAIAAYNKVVEENKAKLKETNDAELQAAEDAKKAKEDLGKQQGAAFSANVKELLSSDGYTYDQKQEILDKDAAFLNTSLALSQYGEEERTRLLNENSEARRTIDEKEKEHKLANLDLVANAADAASDLIGKNTLVGKSLAIASATISTYEGAQKAYTSQMSVPDVSAPVRAAIAAGIAIVQGLARVKAILSVKVPTKSGGGAGGAAPALSAPQINSTMLSADLTKVQDVRVTNQQNQVVKTYITDRDLTTNQQKQDFLKKLGEI